MSTPRTHHFWACQSVNGDEQHTMRSMVSVCCRCSLTWLHLNLWSALVRQIEPSTHTQKSPEHICALRTRVVDRTWKRFELREGWVVAVCGTRLVNSSNKLIIWWRGTSLPLGQLEQLIIAGIAMIYYCINARCAIIDLIVVCLVQCTNPIGTMLRSGSVNANADRLDAPTQDQECTNPRQPFRPQLNECGRTGVVSQHYEHFLWHSRPKCMFWLDKTFCLFRGIHY